MKYFVVADIHGFYSIFIKAIKEKGFDDNNPEHALIICGDAFDRGEEAIELQNFLLTLKAKKRLIYILGNHEHLAKAFLDSYEKFFCNPYTLLTSYHYTNGTVGTFLQLTGMNEIQALKNKEEFIEKAKGIPYVSELIPSAINYFEIDKFIFVHGWIPHFYHSDWRLADDDTWKDASWLNGMDCWAHGLTEPNKTVVCGHWQVSYGHAMSGKGSEFGKDACFEPFEREGIIALDARTSYSKKINCIVIEG